MDELIAAFHFSEPAWLWGLLLCFPVALWLLITPRLGRNERIKNYADDHLMPYLLGRSDVSPRNRWKLFARWAGVWTLLVLAMAGPRWDFTDVQLFRPGTNLLVLFDISRSMNVTDVKPNRLARARQELEDLLEQNRGIRVGLIAFATVAHVVSPITEDMNGISRVLSALDTNLVRLQGSRLSFALERAEELIAGQPAESVNSLLIITDGDFDEAFPAFSPDGSKVAFVSKRGEEPDRTFNTDIFVADIATPGGVPRQVTTYEGADSENSYPAWSPDGSRIAYVRGGDPGKIWYGVNSLAVIDADGGEPAVLTADLDRNVENPIWSEDGRTIRFIVEDDGRAYLARVASDETLVETLAYGEFRLAKPTSIRSGKMALLHTSNFTPPEVFVFADDELAKLSARNDNWLADLELGSARRSAFTSADGTEVRSLIYLPPDYQPGRRHPAVLNLHGGPASQFAHSWDPEILWQLLAGYVVIAPNPRGSTGRGEAFAMAGHGAWGALDVQDVLAAVDDAVEQGIADPERLAVSGWSYGGMLTNYVIASDNRFKAAVSGSSISNIITGFGHDMYIREYMAELGTPWDNLENWMAISYPFFENQRIQTPTLFIVGGEDVNVPTIASEQMYQALKVRGIDTRLVIYPGEYHGISRPSFFRDRIERWNAWLKLYLND